MRDLLWVFGWAIGAMVGLGLAGGLWLSRQFSSGSTRCGLRRKGSWPATGVAASRSRRSTTISPRSRKPSIVCSIGSRSSCWPTSMSARTSPMISANRSLASCVGLKGRATKPPICGRGERCQSRDHGNRRLARNFQRPLADRSDRGRRASGGLQAVDLAEIARDVVEAFQPAAEEEGKILALRLETPFPLRRQGTLDPDDSEHSR